VTDAKDRITLMCLLETYFTEQIFDKDYKFSPSGLYFAPEMGSMESYKEYIMTMPQFSEPEVFGMHANAAITKEINETNDTLGAILSTMNAGGSGGSSDMDTIATNLANSILSDVPAPYDVKTAEIQYPVSYE